MAPQAASMKIRRLLAFLVASVASLMAMRSLQAPQPDAFVGAFLPQALPAARSVAVARFADEGEAEGEAEGEEGEEEEAPEEPPPEPVRIVRPFRSNARYLTYDEYVYRVKNEKPMRIVLARYGVRHKSSFRIRVYWSSHKRRAKTKQYLEEIGFWNPHAEVDDPMMWGLKADRAVHWLREGAQPTNQVATLLDFAGVIRRTGPESKLGKWEWRIPKESGPEAPEGWKYEYPHKVTWNNPSRAREIPEKANEESLPLIEQNGFTGYQRIPMDLDVEDETFSETKLVDGFDNTFLPGYSSPSYKRRFSKDVA